VHSGGPSVVDALNQVQRQVCRDIGEAAGRVCQASTWGYPQQLSLIRTIANFLILLVYSQCED
jgi:hypothetical protein